VKNTRRFFALFLFFCFSISLMSCDEGISGDIENIEIDLSTVMQVYELDDFDLKDIDLLIYYEGGASKSISLRTSMLSQDQEELLSEPGTHELVITYQGFETRLVITIIDPTMDIYAIVFDTQGGREVLSIVAAEGATIEAPEAPSKEGFTFLGWFTSIEEEDPFVFDTMPSKNLILHAKWEEIPIALTHTVTFRDFDGAELKRETVSDGEAASPPLEPSREGHTFTGWDIAFDDVKDDLTVTAQYAINRYVVTFKDDDGTILSEETLDYGTTIVAPSDPQKEGHTFLGWDPSFDSVVANITVTAQYEINQYTVSFETFDGTPINPVTLDYGTSLSDYVSEQEDYIFAGWYLENTFDTLIIAVPAFDTILYAKWIEDITNDEIVDMVQVGEQGITYTIPIGSSDSGTATVEGGYLMATTETTYELWYEVRIWAETNGYHFDNLGREGDGGTIGAAPTEAKLEPVTTVSWRDVIVWTNALSEMTGLDPVYRTAEGIISGWGDPDRQQRLQTTHVQ